MELNNIETKPFENFSKEWALVTAGSKDGYNTMTIGWGAMGTLWSTPVVIVFVKPVRYTSEFLKDNEYFCLGDNRDVSNDSRFYGPFKKENIETSHIFILYPFNRIGFIK